MSKIINYLKLSRINNPTGIFLLLLPCFYAIALVVKLLPDPNYYLLAKMLLLFILGAVLMRSAGCVINDLLDAKFDIKVARTKNRPIVTGAVSKTEALIFLLCLLFFAFIILVQFNFATIITGIFAFFLVLFYPLSKRITYFPQIILGFTFNLGVFMVSFAILEELSEGIIVLFLICLVWTIIYDTIYAFQDLEDDLKIGTKSTAIAFGLKAKIMLQTLNLLMFFAMLILGALQTFALPYFIITFALSIYQAIAIKKCNLSNHQQCLSFFKKSTILGIFFLIAISFG
jgi:4-hydroxybenzoate polyprenyltransferase